MSYELTCIKGSMSGRRWTIPSTGLKIGSAAACEVCLADGAVDAYHCVLEVSGESVSVNNLASDAGVNVNGVFVRNKVLSPSDVIRVGGEQFIVTVAQQKKSAPGLLKVLPWLGMLALGGVIAYLLTIPKGGEQASAPNPSSASVLSNVVTSVENTTNVSNVFNVATVTNDLGVVVVKTNTIVRDVDGDGKGGEVATPEVKKCACPPGTNHIGKCPCDGAPDCKCRVSVPAPTADDLALFFGAGSCKEAKAFEGIVQANMADSCKALLKKEKLRREVADVAFKMADRHAMEPYQRFLYMKGAFFLYLCDDCSDEAMRTWLHIRLMLPELDPRVAVEMFEQALTYRPNFTHPVWGHVLARERARVPFAEALEKQQAKATTDLTSEDRLAIADNAAALGYWPLFERAMASAGDKWRNRMSVESSPTATASQLVQLGNLWWSRGEDRPDVMRAAFRLRAAKCYAQALTKKEAKSAYDEDARQGLELRIQTAYAGADARPYAGNDEYILIDLSGGPSAPYYPVRPLDIEKLKEHGTGTVVWPDVCKTKGLVLKRIKPGVLDANGLKFHLTRPYYMGIFEVTQRQYELVMGNNPSKFKDDGRKPVERVSCDMVRGNNFGRTWPMSAEVDEQSFLGRLRRKTALAFDLPTEIQWEYACRAGRPGEYDGETDSKEMDKLGRHRDNGGVIPDPDGLMDENGKVKLVYIGPAVVGSYRPNAWGLYDMHGNVLEWCKDCSWHRRGEIQAINDGYLQDDSKKESLTDPMGNCGPVWRYVRGGSWFSGARESRASWHARTRRWNTYDSLGFRLACPQGR